MTTQQDLQIMAGVESVYGTGVTPSRTVEFVDEDFDWTPEFGQGAGLRVGKRVARADRRVTNKSSVAGGFTVEPYTKGQGWMWQAALGAGASTLISGSAYQQVFSLGSTDYLQSWTVQVGVPPVGGAATLPHTYTGMVCSGFEASFGNGAIPTVKFNFMGRDITLATGLATAAYPASTQTYGFVSAQIVVGGTITAPTTTALATSTGTFGTANIRDFDLTWDNALDSEGFNFNGAGKRSRSNALGLRAGTGTFTAEFTDNLLETALLAQTNMGLLLTYQLPNIAGNLISGSSYPTLQIAIPTIVLEGELPKSNGGDVVAQSMGFTVLDGGVAASPIYVTLVTADTTI